MFTTTKDTEVQALASQRLAENLHKIVRIALSTYHKQSPQYRAFASPTRYARTLVLMTYRGFYQEILAEQKQAKAVKGKRFKFRLTVKNQPETQTA